MPDKVVTKEERAARAKAILGKVAARRERRAKLLALKQKIAARKRSTDADKRSERIAARKAARDIVTEVRPSTLRERLAETRKAALSGTSRGREAARELTLETVRKMADRRSTFASEGGSRGAINRESIVKSAIRADSRGRYVEVEKQDDRVVALKRKNDEIYIMSKMLNVPATRLKTYRDFRGSSLYKAMYGGSGNYGGDWVPTELSADIADRVSLELKLAEKIRRQPMPTSPYEMPYVASGTTAYLVPETTLDTESATRVTATQMGTGKVTLTAKKMGARVCTSTELSEDAIRDVIPAIQEDLTKTFKETLENALINGDTTTTHQDSDVTTSTDFRKAWIGFRKYARTASSQVDLSTWNAATIRTAKRTCGKYGVYPSDGVWVVGVQTYNALLTLKDDQNNPVLITRDKYGEAATILTGEVGQLFGSPVIVSEYIRETLNVSGVYDGTTVTKTVLLYVYTPGFVIGDRRNLTIKIAEDIDFDNLKIVATQRLAFSAIRASTEKMVCTGYNITSAL